MKKKLSKSRLKVGKNFKLLQRDVAQPFLLMTTHSFIIASHSECFGSTENYKPHYVTKSEVL